MNGRNDPPFISSSHVVESDNCFMFSLNVHPWFQHVYVNCFQHAEALSFPLIVNNFCVIHQVLSGDARAVCLPHVPLQLPVLFVVGQSPGQCRSGMANIAHRVILRLTILMWAREFIYNVGRL